MHGEGEGGGGGGGGAVSGPAAAGQYSRVTQSNKASPFTTITWRVLEAKAAAGHRTGGA